MMARPATRLPRRPAPRPAEALCAALNSTLDPNLSGFAMTIGNAATILAVLSAAGWVLVPKVPTEVMVEAGRRRMLDDSFAIVASGYRAMLAARPK